MAIEFIDRQLKEGEISHYRCRKCENYVNADLIHNHKCPEISPGLEYKMKISEAKINLNLKREK